MQSDQAVSLRPGGGKGRPFAPRSTSSSSPIANFDPGAFAARFPFLDHDGKSIDFKAQKLGSERIQYTRDELYKFKEVITDIPKGMEIAISELESEVLLLEEQEWARPVTNVQALPPAVRYSEPDNRDWKSRTPLPSPVPEEKGKDQQPKEVGMRSDSDWREKEQEHDLSNLQTLSRQQETPRPQHSFRHQEAELAASGVDARPAPAILRAANPWSARRGALSDREKVLRTVKGILNKLTPDKFELLLEQLLNAGIDSADILKGVISLVFDKAVLEPTFCPMYAELCVHLSKALPEFTSDEEDGKAVTFRRILLNSCQEEFEGADKMREEVRQMTKPEQEVDRFEKEKLVKLRTLGNIRLIGELFKQKMIPEKIVHYCITSLLGLDSKNPPADEDVEALCQLLLTIGKQLEENPKSRTAVDSYFARLKEYSNSAQLPPRIRFRIRDIIDLRAKRWVPRREEVKAKTINEIHAEAEQMLGLRPGITGMRNGRGAPGVMGLPGMGNSFPLSRPGSMMPGMPGLLPVGKMSGTAPLMPVYVPSIESEGWETFSVGRRSKGVRKGLVSPPNTLPARPLSVPAPVLRPNSASSKLLAQSSGASFLGRPSALLGESVAKVGASIPRQDVGIPESIAQGQHSAPLRNPVAIPEQERLAGPPKQAATGPLSSAALSKKCESLLKEYLSVADLNEAMLCVEELQSPDFHYQLVQSAVSMGVEGHERDIELIGKLLEFLHSKRILSENDVRTGIMLVAEQLEDLALDIPMAPKLIGDLLGKLSLSGVVDLSLLVEILKKEEDPQLKRIVHNAAMKAIKSGPNSESVLRQRCELEECERLVEVAAM